MKETKADFQRATSLVEQATADERSVKEAKLTELNVSTYVVVAYSSLRETLEAVCLLNGLHVTSHICVGEVARKFIPNFSFSDFDRFRFARNGISYYGTKIEFEEGRGLIGEILLMKRAVAEYIESKWKLGVKGLE
ncbi:MAG: hypothetical protein V1820_00185 [archaeon]